MQIRKIIERKDLAKFLLKRNLLQKYIKAKKFILDNHSNLVDLKKRKPKENEIWQFRIDKQFRAFCYFDKDTLVVFEINNHQN